MKKLSFLLLGLMLTGCTANKIIENDDVSEQMDLISEYLVDSLMTGELEGINDEFGVAVNSSLHEPKMKSNDSSSLNIRTLLPEWRGEGHPYTGIRMAINDLFSLLDEETEPYFPGVLPHGLGSLTTHWFFMDGLLKVESDKSGQQTPLADGVISVHVDFRMMTPYTDRLLHFDGLTYYSTRVELFDLLGFPDTIIEADEYDELEYGDQRYWFRLPYGRSVSFLFNPPSDFIQDIFFR